MNFLAELGVDSDLFNYIILPILIFLARIFDVSIATIRIIFVLSGKKVLAPLLGFFESLVWLMAIGQIIQNVDNVFSYIAFAAGFACGTLVGILLEEKIALGNVVVRVITRMPAKELIDFLISKNYQYSNVKAEGKDGDVNILFTVLNRNKLDSFIAEINRFNPNAFFTIEGVKKVSESGIVNQRSSWFGLKLQTLKRR